MTDFVPFTAAHLDTVVMLERAVFAGRGPWSRMAFEGELMNPQALWLVAMAGDAVIGYGGGWVGGGEYHLLNLAVAPVARRRGTGRALVAALLGAAAARGCGRATLEVRRGNGPARKLYEGLGFREAGVRPRHYQDGEDAVIYTRDSMGESVSGK